MVAGTAEYAPFRFVPEACTACDALVGDVLDDQHQTAPVYLDRVQFPGWLAGKDRIDQGWFICVVLCQSMSACHGFYPLCYVGRDFRLRLPRLLLVAVLRT
jgi:uncharacterized protein (DUF779 family)